MMKFLFSSPYLNWRRGEKKLAVSQMAFSMSLMLGMVAYQYNDFKKKSGQA